MRFLLDTNILIPLEDSRLRLEPSLANFVRLANDNGHQLIYHPASNDDISREKNEERKRQTFERLVQYTCLDSIPPCPWNTEETSLNDASDNAILYALYCDAVDALVTEDRGIHRKAKNRGLGERVFAIQAAEDLLRRLHETTSVHLPNIQNVPLHSLTPELDDDFFKDLRADYPAFITWFREKAREQRKAWICRDEQGKLGALCIYATKNNDVITDSGRTLSGPSLKLCTFIVGPTSRGRKIGELFLKAAFRFATWNRLENIYVHGSLEKQGILFDLLADFGFFDVGTYKGDAVYLKEHPLEPPQVDGEPFEYCKRYFPHFKDGSQVRKYLVPIQPEFHRILFSDYPSPFDMQLELFCHSHTVSNAIKQAYLCHANARFIRHGDIVLFYRSTDEQAITSLGIVEQYESSQDANEIVKLVRRRTVYSMAQINEMARKQTKVILFRLVKHFNHPTSFRWLIQNKVVNGNIQTIQEIDDDAYQKIIRNAA